MVTTKNWEVTNCFTRFLLAYVGKWILPCSSGNGCNIYYFLGFPIGLSTYGNNTVSTQGGIVIVECSSVPETKSFTRGTAGTFSVYRNQFIITARKPEKRFTHLRNFSPRRYKERSLHLSTKAVNIYLRVERLGFACSSSDWAPCFFLNPFHTACDVIVVDFFCNRILNEFILRN